MNDHQRPEGAGAQPAIGRSAALMGVATATSRAFGFVRVIVIAGVLGTTHLGNAYQGSNLVSNVLFELLAAGALSAVLVPGFVKLFQHRRQEDAERLAGSLVGLGLVMMGAVAVAGVFTAPAIATVLTAGVDDPAVAEAQREISTFLLRFFIPQVLLYVFGAVATAVLHAQRRFVVAAAAPIANTVVIVAGLLVFAALRGGQEPSLDVSLAERLTLGITGTLGVAAFVGVPTVALLAGGFRFRPRWGLRDTLVSQTLRHAGWAGFQNASVGILLGAAVIVGMGVPGGVVAYYVAYTFFLVPYAVLGQSIHDVILPELTRDATSGNREEWGQTVRWGLDALCLLVAPAAVAYVVLARPIMEVVAFGEATAAGASMMAAALVTLALGLLPYSAFLLLTRASYSLGETRIPTLVSVGSALTGAVFMFSVGSRFDGSGRLAAMGGGVALAYVVASLVLGTHLSRRVQLSLFPRAFVRAASAAMVVGAVVWVIWVLVDPTARAAKLALLAITGVLGALAYIALAHPPSLRRVLAARSDHGENS